MALFGSVEEAQKYIDDTMAGRVVWDDNKLSPAKDIVAGKKTLSGQEIKSSSDYLKEALDIAIAANQPAIQTLQEGVGPGKALYESEAARLESTKDPLNQRYDQLIADIVGNQTGAQNRQIVTTKNELAKRGVSTLSGVGAQEVTNAVNPITLAFTGLLKNAGLDRETALQNVDALISQTKGAEQQYLQGVRQQIASLQAGAATTGLNLGSNLFTQQQNYNLQQQSLEIKKQTLAQKEAEAAYNQTFKTQYQAPYYEAQSQYTLARAQALLNGTYDPSEDPSNPFGPDGFPT